MQHDIFSWKSSFRWSGGFPSRSQNSFLGGNARARWNWIFNLDKISRWFKSIRTIPQRTQTYKTILIVFQFSFNLQLFCHKTLRFMIWNEKKEGCSSVVVASLLFQLTWCNSSERLPSRRNKKVKWGSLSIIDQTTNKGMSKEQYTRAAHNQKKKDKQTRVTRLAVTTKVVEKGRKEMNLNQSKIYRILSRCCSGKTRPLCKRRHHARLLLAHIWRAFSKQPSDKPLFATDTITSLYRHKWHYTCDIMFVYK